MSWSAEYVAAENQVELAASGPVFNRDAREQAAEVIRLIKRHDADFVLVDYTRVVLEVSLANLYWLPEYYIELGAPQHVHVALVLPPGLYHSHRFECNRSGPESSPQHRNDSIEHRVECNRSEPESSPQRIRIAPCVRESVTDPSLRAVRNFQRLAT